MGQLSGGEKGKAALARLAATGANLLVMDEPTNHLDIWSCEALERSIKEFEGTVLVVSHDRYFLNQVADRLVVVSDGRAMVVEGDYETYQTHHEVPGGEGQCQGAASATKTSKPDTASEKRRRQFPYRKTDDLEREITETEFQLAGAEAALAEPETWKDADLARSTQARYDELKARTEELYSHYEEALELNK